MKGIIKGFQINNLPASSSQNTILISCTVCGTSQSFTTEEMSFSDEMKWKTNFVFEVEDIEKAKFFVTVQANGGDAEDLPIAQTEFGYAASSSPIDLITGGKLIVSIDHYSESQEKEQTKKDEETIKGRLTKKRLRAFESDDDSTPNQSEQKSEEAPKSEEEEQSPVPEELIDEEENQGDEEEECEQDELGTTIVMAQKQRQKRHQEKAQRMELTDEEYQQICAEAAELSEKRYNYILRHYGTELLQNQKELNGKEAQQQEEEDSALGEEESTA